MFNQRYEIGKTTKTETRVHQCNIFLNRDDTSTVLNVQQLRYLCISNSKVFEDITDNGDMNVKYDVLVVLHGAPHHGDGCRGLSEHNYRFYLCSEVFLCCGTSMKGYFNSIYITTGVYRHL